MEWYSWIITNKDILKIIYGFVIGIICLIIVAKSHRLYHLSFYEGIRYFRNAFLFFGIAFIIRYLFGGFAVFGIINPDYVILTVLLFEYFILMAGFFLIYSLLWKKIEGSGKGNFSSIVNSRVLIFYIMALIITILDYLWNGYYFMFFCQMIIFVFATIISYVNYRRNGRKGIFLKFYFLAMILALIAWLLNAITALYFEWDKVVLFLVYLLNIVIFLLFLYGLFRITKKTKKLGGI